LFTPASQEAPLLPIPQFLIEMPVVRNALIGIWNSYVRHLKPRYSVEQRMGVTLLLDKTSNLDRALLVRGKWEEEQIRTLRQMIRDSRANVGRSLFLDIGAHAALYSVIVAREGLCDEIHAFEPDPINLAQAQANLLLNDVVERVRLIAAAVTEHPGRLPFHRAESLRRGESRLDWSDTNKRRFVQSIEVEAIRLDDMFDDEGTLIAAKIDVEGHELQALRGMTKLLRQNDCILQVEIARARVPSVLSFIEAQGYRRVHQIRDDYFFTH
jgi:FkbM family methyltransferase